MVHFKSSHFDTKFMFFFVAHVFTCAEVLGLYSLLGLFF